MRLSFSPVGNYFAVAALALLLIGLLTFVPLAAPTNRGRRRAIAGVRAGVILLMILALLRPTVVYTTTHRQAATLVLLVDRSRSMQVADTFGNKTRWQELQTILGDAVPLLADLAEDLEIKLYAFDADVQPIDFHAGKFELGSMPQGPQTAIGYALAEVLRREAGKRLIGVVLLSDGTQRAYAPRDIPPQIPARQLADLGFPLDTVVFGQARGLGAARDVALENIEVNDTVFVKNELSVAGTAKVDGFMNDNIPVELLFETASGEMAVVGQTQISSTQDGQLVPVEVTYAPQTAGEYKVMLRAVSPPGDVAPANNELSTFITVRKGGINVLYLEGAHPVEAKFLRRGLEAFPDLRVDYLWMDARAKQTRPADLAARFEPGKYDVYVIGDLDSTAFEPAELAKLADTVRAGAGLMMLGGLHSFGPGGYQKTALAEVLPVRMMSLERQNFDEAIAADLHLPGPFKMQPTKIGEQLRIMLLAPPEKNRNAWAELPPLDGANRFRGLAPLANVLAESDDAARVPLLVAQTPGNGRVLAFAGDSTWHWVLEGFESQHKRFWRQAVLWLAKKDEAQEGSVWVRLAQRRFQPGGRVEFSAGAQSPDGAAIADASFTAEIALPDGSRRPVHLNRKGDEFTGSFIETEAAGDYKVIVSATQNGQNLGTAQARFLVFAQDLELEKPVADLTLLASLAQMAGGEALAPEQFGAFLERLKANPPSPIVEVETKQTPWDTWPFFLLLAGLLSVEWWLRKRWGLV